ncbi:MAG: transporter substrate-binding domain-containing protein [Atopobiaceae bacterium]|nr:transporter substrate-binding domain-containing protein [Atopobiaceae bacterium]
MRVAKMPHMMLGAAVVAALMLTGCKSVNEFLDEHFVFTSVDDYLSQVRSEAVPSVSPGATKTEGVLTVGLRSSQTAPLVIASEGKVRGLDVDLACALADELGLRVAFVTVPDVRTGLDGPCDVVMGSNALESHGYELMGEYAYNSVGLFQYGSDKPRATLGQVRGSRVAVQEGSAAQLTLSHANLDVEEVLYPMLTDAFEALVQGEADFVACNAAAGQYVCTLRGGYSFAGSLDTPVPLGIAVANGEDELRTALAEAYARMQTNGLLDTTKAPWVGLANTVGPDAQISESAAPEPVPDAEPAPAEPAPAEPAPAEPAPAEPAPAEPAPAETNPAPEGEPAPEANPAPEGEPTPEGAQVPEANPAPEGEPAAQPAPAPEEPVLAPEGE